MIKLIDWKRKMIFLEINSLRDNNIFENFGTFNKYAAFFRQSFF